MLVRIPVNSRTYMDKDVLDEFLNNKSLIFQYMINNKILSGLVTNINIEVCKHKNKINLYSIEGELIVDAPTEKTFVFSCNTSLDTVFGFFPIELQIWKLN